MKRFKSALSFLMSLAVMFSLLWGILTISFPYGSLINVVEGRSMEPTLHDGQLIFTDMSKIARGDIVASYFPDIVRENSPELSNTTIVKRVVGIPGDKIEVSNHEVYVNGRLLEEPYLAEEAKRYTSIEKAICTEVELKDGEYYLLGDNRGCSNDSRMFGPVTKEDLQYKQTSTFNLNMFIRCIYMLAIAYVCFKLFFVIKKLLDKLLHNNE